VQYFCDGRRLARAHTEAPFGDEFSEATADVYFKGVLGARYGQSHRNTRG
jgi:hypothetical protein